MLASQKLPSQPLILERENLVVRKRGRPKGSTNKPKPAKKRTQPTAPPTPQPLTPQPSTLQPSTPSTPQSSTPQPTLQSESSQTSISPEPYLSPTYQHAQPQSPASITQCSDTQDLGTQDTNTPPQNNMEPNEEILKLYVEFGKAEIRNAKSNYQVSKVYERMVERMVARGLNYSKSMIKDAISNSKRKFKRENFRRSGLNEPSEWELFDLAMDAFGSDHDIIPAAVTDSLNEAGPSNAPEARGTQPAKKPKSPRKQKLTSFQKEYFKRMDRFLELYERDLSKPN